MNSLNFLDANVWLALLWRPHVHAEKARQWFEACADERFFFCRFAQLTVLRLLTTRSLMGPDVRTMAQAWDVWDHLWADVRISFVPEPDGLETELRARTHLGSISPKAWADEYMIAFAALAGVRLVTFDRALASKAAEVVLL